MSLRLRNHCGQSAGGGLARLSGLVAGQALVELLVAMLALLLLWAATAWLGRLQDIALQAGHAARHLAFSAVRQKEGDWGGLVRAAYFDGLQHRWMDRRGQSLLKPEEQGVAAQVSRLDGLLAAAQPGGASSQAGQLRNDWQVSDNGVVHASVRIAFQNALKPVAGPAWGDGLRAMDSILPSIHRHAYILEGAGHADDDISTRQRLEQANMPWARAATASYGLSGRVSGFMEAVDRPWGRANPGSDWLTRWQEWLPQNHIVDYEVQP